jgi:hypothetical protein
MAAGAGSYVLSEGKSNGRDPAWIHDVTGGLLGLASEDHWMDRMQHAAMET